MRSRPSCIEWKRTVQAPSKCSEPLTTRHRTGISVRFALFPSSLAPPQGYAQGDDSLHEGHNGPNECIRTITELIGPNRHCSLQVSESQINVDHDLVSSLLFVFTVFWGHR